MAGGTRRVVIVGGGHNGLVAAFYLAKAGWAPLVLERREILGGVAAIEEIHPGFRCPTILQPRRPSTVALDPNGGTLRISDESSTLETVRYVEFQACLRRFSAALQPLLSNAPPDIDH